MGFSEKLKGKSAVCDEILQQYFADLDDHRTTLFESMKYSLKTGGKRLRMILLLECAQLFSENVEDCFPFACAVEMIHTYSLIHDDLPAMDDAEFRRGKLSNHKVYGEGMAILAGDGLLHYAFEVMVAASLQHDAEKSRSFLRAMNEIAFNAGTGGMLLGQSIDIQTDQSVDVDLLKFIYSKKTASMFIGPMKAGAIISGAGDAEVDSISAFALNLGMAFQIVDDILDETGSFEEVGKNPGNDMGNNKVTISSILGIDEAYSLAKEYISEAKKALSIFEERGFLVDLCDYIINRKS